MSRLKTLLTIGGTDPTSGAGIAADLNVFRDFGYHGLSVPTLAIAQSSDEVSSLGPVDTRVFEAALNIAFESGRPLAIKLGVLGTIDNVRAVVAALSQIEENVPVVLDPVLAATSGSSLADPGFVPTLIEQLLPLCDVVTPNIPEAEQLTGMTIDDLETAKVAGTKLVNAGAKAVLVKGGHLPGAPGDVLVSRQTVQVLANTTQFAVDVHGTGCHLSSALAALLVDGLSVVRACRGARTYLQNCVEAAATLEGEIRQGRGRPIIVHGLTTVQAADVSRSVATR